MRVEKDLLFGAASKPVRCKRGMTIGAGIVYPEINFTLPAMKITEQTWSEICKEYDTILNSICQRAVELHCPGLVVEFELLPPMTFQPKWGAEITEILQSVLETYYQKEQLSRYQTLALCYQSSNSRNITSILHNRQAKSKT